MRRPGPRLIILACGVAAGCGGSGGDQSPAASTPSEAATPSAPIKQPLPKNQKEFDSRISELIRLSKGAEVRGDTDQVAAIEAELRRLERAEAKAQAEQFAPTKFEKALDELPFDKPPLYVEQVITEGTHRVVVRTKARRFFCGRSLDERLQAVSSYFAQFKTVMESANIKDGELVVDAMRDTGVVRPIAVADETGVRLTARGSGTGPC